MARLRNAARAIFGPPGICKWEGLLSLRITNNTITPNGKSHLNRVSPFRGQTTCNRNNEHNIMANLEQLGTKPGNNLGLDLG